MVSGAVCFYSKAGEVLRVTDNELLVKICHVPSMFTYLMNGLYYF